MANREISQFTALAAAAQTPTMVFPIVDPSLGSTAAANKKITLNNLFANLGLNTTDKAIAQTGVATGSAPSVSAASQMKWYFNTTDSTFKLSRNTGAYGTIQANNAGSVTPGIGATQTIDLRIQTMWTVLLPAGNITVSTAGTPLFPTYFTIQVYQDAIGGRTITWGGTFFYNSAPITVQPDDTANSATTFNFYSDGLNCFLISWSSDAGTLNGLTAGRPVYASSSAAVSNLAWPTVVVSSYANAGNGSSGSPWTGWDTAVSWAANTKFIFPAGYYAYASAPNFAFPGIVLQGEAGTYLQHIGTGNAFIMDSGAGSVWQQNMLVENINILGHVVTGAGTATATIATNTVTGAGTTFTWYNIGDSFTFQSASGNEESHLITAITDNTHLTVGANWVASQAGAFVIGKSLNGFYLRGIRNSVFRNCTAKDVNGAAILTQACVTNILENFQTSYAIPVSGSNFRVRPQYGIVTDTRGADLSTCWTIINPVIEGMQTYGFWFTANSYGNTVINGTSEGNRGIAVGAQIDGNYNQIIGTDIEANSSGKDVNITGSNNNLLSIVSASTVTISGGSKNRLVNGQFQNITIGAAADQTYLDGAHATGTLTDGGTRTYQVQSQWVPTDATTKIGMVLPWVTVDSVSAGAIATDCRLGNYRVAQVTANATFSAPTNGASCQILTWRIAATGGPWTLAFNAVFNFGIFSAPVSIASNEKILLVASYDLAANKWNVMSLERSLPGLTLDSAGSWSAGLFLSGSSGGSYGLITANGATNGVFITGGPGVGGLVIKSDVSANDYLGLGANSQVSWTTIAGNGYTAKNVAFGWNSSGVIEINSGSSGAFRDLKLRNLIIATRQQNLIVSTGAGSALLGANSPAVTLTAPFEWINVTLSDGSVGYVPAWK